MLQSASSQDALRYVWIHWRIIGMHPPNSWRLLYTIYAWPAMFFLMVVEPIHMLLSFVLVNDFVRMLDVFSIGLCLLFAAIKQILILPFVTSNLERARQHLIVLDAYAEDYDDDQMALRLMIRFCHRLYYFYLFTFANAHIIFSIVGLLRHQPMFESWFPFDWHGSHWYYATAFQMIAAVLQITQNIANDVYPPLYLIVMTTHYRLLNQRIIRIGIDKKRNIQSNNEELLDCIAMHKEILAFHDCISVVISRTMLAQFLTTAFILCTTAVYFLTSRGDVTDMLRVTIYLSLVLLEILPCCWYVNAMMDESTYLTTALYSCQWYKEDICFRKTLITFMQRSQKNATILAGALAPVTLQTFLSIVRFSFSMFTILNQIKMN